jgi:diacylglycerol kinase family enzyme
MERVVDAAVFVNPSAGRAGAGRKIGQVREAFSRRNYHVRIAQSGSRDEIRDDVRAAIDGGCTTLIAMGGDGTVTAGPRMYWLSGSVIPAGGGMISPQRWGSPMIQNKRLE